MLGMNFSELDIEWPAPLDMVRCWDIQCDPARIMAGGKDSYDWSRLDRFFDKANSVGASVVYVAHGCPEWQAKGTGEHNAPWMPPKANSEWKDINVFGEFIWNLVTRYKDRGLTAVEVGNEAANLKDFYEKAGTKAGAESLATMHKKAYRIVKDVAPNVLVVGNSILPRKSSGGVSKADKFLAAMHELKWPVDAMSCHLYPLPDKPDANGGGANFPEFERDYDLARDAVKKHKGPSKMWITEWNVDLLKPTLSDSKANNVIRKIREKHKGYSFYYAWSRADLKGTYVGPNTIACDEMRKFKNG